jgi:uncharacterized protein (TIGR02757 family)
MKKKIFFRNENYYLYLAKQACDMRFYNHDMVWLPRYYSLCINPSMTGWRKNERENFEKHPLYREIPIVDYRKQDVEIAAVLAAWVNFGNTLSMPNRCAELRKILTEHPYNSLLCKDYKYWRYNVLETCFSRYIYQDLIDLFDRLWRIYQKHSDLEAAVSFALRKRDVDHIQAILLLFEGVNGFRPNNPDTLFRINMMCRWLTLSYKVDIGIWHVIDPRDLHVSLRASDIKKLPKLSAFKKLRLDSKDFQEVVDDTARKYFPRCPAVMDYLIKTSIFGYREKLKIPCNVANKSQEGFLSSLVAKDTCGRKIRKYRQIEV